MEIIKEFGFDPLLLGAQIVNFLIIFFILKKFVFKPVLQTLKNRENTIKDGLKDAEEGHRKLEEAIEKEKSIIKNAQIEADKILTDARNQSKEIIGNAEKKSKTISEEMISATKSQIELEYKGAEKSLAIKVSDMAVEFLEKSLTGLFGDTKQKELMQIAIKKIKKTN